MASIRMRWTARVLALWTARVVLVVTLLAPVGVAVSTAHADDNDEKFLAALRAQNIKYASPEAAIAAGRLVCSKLDQGETPTQVAYDVMNSDNLDGFHAGYFVGASIGKFCPKYR